MYSQVCFENKQRKALKHAAGKFMGDIVVAPAPINIGANQIQPTLKQCCGHVGVTPLEKRLEAYERLGAN